MRNDPSVAHNGGMQARVAAAAAALNRDASTESPPAGTNSPPTTITHAELPLALPSPQQRKSGALSQRKGLAEATVFDPFGDISMPIVTTHTSQHAGAVSSFIRTVLAPLAAQSAQLFAGQGAGAAAAASSAQRRRHLTVSLHSEIMLGIEATQALATSFGTMRRGAIVASARATAATPRGCVPGPAWRALLGVELPCEATVRLLITRFGAAAAFSRARGAVPEDLTPAEAAWLDELYKGQMAGLQLLTQVSILQHEIKLAPMNEFMDCAGAVLEMLRAYAADCALSFTSRSQWVHRLMPGPAELEGPDGEVQAPCTPLYRFLGRQESDVMPVKLSIDPPPGTGDGCEDILAERDAARLL